MAASTNARLHRHAVARVRRALEARGLAASPADGYRQSYDLLVQGFGRVAVRVARAARRKHVVTTCGRRYEYMYPEAAWNKHSHGRRVEGVDVWVLALCERPAWRFFAIPHSAHRGLTLSVNPTRLDGDGEHCHWLSRYEMVETPAA